MAEPVPVKVRECACPGHPHNGEGDVVLLAATISLDGGLAAEQDLVAVNAEHPTDVPARIAAVTRRWASTFIRYGATGWNLLDDEGNPVPFDVDAVLSDYLIARPVADKAADLYTDAVMRPFLTKQDNRSPTGRTTNSTSRRRRSGPKSSE